MGIEVGYDGNYPNQKPAQPQAACCPGNLSNHNNWEVDGVFAGWTASNMSPVKGLGVGVEVLWCSGVMSQGEATVRSELSTS